MEEREFPKRIICMTEESVELLYKLGASDKIVGISSYVKRPPEAKGKPVISSFTRANIEKIKDLKPDLVLGFSDVQKDIARDLIGEGLNVWIANQRTLEEVLDYMLALGSLVDKREETLKLISGYEQKMEEVKKRALGLRKRPKVYLEEWDEPMICGIRYFSDLVTVCGGEDIFRERSFGKLAKERIVTSEEVVTKNPEYVLASWCGKKVDEVAIAKREGWNKVKAIRDDKVLELDPAIFLQPGPALFEEGLYILSELFCKPTKTGTSFLK